MQILLKVIIGGLLIFMLFNLFRAMWLMLKANPDQPSMSKFIGRRVFTSAAIIMLILLALAFGIITPNPRPY